jgi:hypothetical protein
MAPLSTSPVCVPLTKMTVRGSSISFGSLASRARLDRAFLGFLDVQRISIYEQNHEVCWSTDIVLSIRRKKFGSRSCAMHVIVCPMAQLPQWSQS